MLKLINTKIMPRTLLHSHLLCPAPSTGPPPPPPISNLAGKHHDKSVSSLPISATNSGALEGEKHIIAKIVYNSGAGLGSRSKLNLLVGSRRFEIEDEWIVILLMNVMVVMRLMIRTICQQRIPRPSSASSSTSSTQRPDVNNIL